MRTIEIGKHKVEVFDSAEMMPMKRYQRFNKFLMIDNEVGSDFADFNKRSSKAIELLKKGLLDEAVKELDNRRQMVYNAFMGYSPKGRAMAIMVHSIDGEVFTDYSKGGLDKVIDRLDEIGFTYALTDETVRDVKKK